MPADPAALAALAARLEAATEGGRELDIRIAHWAGTGNIAQDVDLEHVVRILTQMEDAYEDYCDEDSQIRPARPAEMLVDRVGWFDVPLYTTSLDAAVALCERVHPDAWWVVRRHHSHDDMSAIATLEMRGHPYVAGARAPTPPLALCKAIIAAKLATCTPSSP